MKTVVHESNLEFEVELESYADTGLFLDHYRTRQMIRQMCRGLDVLNLFSYTGSFSVYAAAGQAKSVTSVDLSSTYTNWAVENLKRNGFSGMMYSCVCEDAEVFVDRQLEENTKYDIIIFDPPSFSNSHKMKNDFDVSKDGLVWIKKLACLLRENGMLLFSTNLGSFKMDKRKLRGLSVHEVTDRLMAPGFSKNRKGAVRSWIMTVEDSSLNLDWSEESKPQKKKEYGKNEYKPRQHSTYRNDRFDKSRPHGNYHSERHYNSDKEERYSEKRQSYSTSYSDRPKRNYYSEDRPQRRYENRDSDRRDSGRRYSERSERPERSFRSERSERFEKPERSERTERFDRRERTERNFNHGNNEHRTNSFSPRRQTKTSKPYGYDSFKPARSRNEDDPDLFWN